MKGEETENEKVGGCREDGNGEGELTGRQAKEC